MGRWLDRLEILTYDWRTRATVTPAGANPGIVFVEVNDTTLVTWPRSSGRWPWPRAAFSMLIDYLHRGSPKVIAIDFTFAEPNSGVTFMLAGERWTGEEATRRWPIR